MEPMDVDHVPGVDSGEAESQRAYSPPAIRRSLPMDANPVQVAVPTNAALTNLPPAGDDCGHCAHCLDKPKFGGKGTQKQACVMRRCVAHDGENRAVLISVLRVGTGHGHGRTITIGSPTYSLALLADTVCDVMLLQCPPVAVRNNCATASDS